MVEIAIFRAFSAAIRCHISGSFDQAEEYYDVMLAAGRYAHRADILYLKALIARAKNNFAQAEELIARACRESASVAWFHELLGAAYPIEQLEEIVRLFVADIALRPACRPFGDDRVSLPNVTLVCIDTASYNLSLIALKNALAQCRFTRALLFTDKDLRVPGVETIRIPPLSALSAYSIFVMRELGQFIDTSHLLVVQWDGFVLDAKWWSDSFFDYDYIGAKWEFQDGYNVGNSGFALMSRRLLTALRDPAIIPGHPDDGLICRTYRPLLESSYGIRYAPEAVAERFSYENVPSRAPTFGVHGAYNFMPVLDRQCAHFLIPSLPAYLRKSPWLRRLRIALNAEGYESVAQEFAAFLTS